MFKDNYIRGTLIVLLAMIALSGGFAILNLNESTINPMDTSEKGIQIALYRLEAYQTNELKAFDSVYTQLADVSLSNENSSLLKRIVSNTYGFDDRMRLILEDGRYFNGSKVENRTDASSMASFFESNATIDDTLFEIEAYNNQDGQLLASISRKIVDATSGKAAILIREVDFKDFVLELKNLIDDGESKVYLIDQQNRFADLMGTSNSMLDVSGIKNLVNRAQNKGVLQHQKINEQNYTIIEKELKTNRWSLVALIKEKPFWYGKTMIFMAFLTLFILSNILLYLLYKRHVQVKFEIEKQLVVEDFYSAFKAIDGMPQWETDAMHSAKFNYRSLVQIVPFIRTSAVEKHILTLAVNALAIDPTVKPLETNVYENLVIMNRDILNFIRVVCNLQNSDVLIEFDEPTFDFNLSYEHIQMLLLIGSHNEMSSHSGRIMVSGESAGKSIVIEFFGDLQRYLGELYKSILHQSEYYQLFSEISLLKLGSKLVLNPKAQKNELPVFSSVLDEDKLPQRIYWIDQDVPEGTILKLMIKSLGIDVLKISADNLVSLDSIVVLDSQLYDSYSKLYIGSLPKCLVYGEKSIESIGRTIQLGRPYQLHKIRYALTLLERFRN